jgi:Phage tail assembly chaperone proteins, E, or 41 or 14
MSETQREKVPNFAKMEAEELPGVFVLHLLRPIRFGKEPSVEIHTRIDLQEPTLDQIDEFMKNVKKHGEVSALKHFIADVADQPFPIIGKMGARDMTVAQEYLTAFFKGSQTTGDTSQG